LSTALRVHRNTLCKRMWELGIHKKFDNLNAEEFDAITCEYKAKKPTSGLWYLCGCFWCNGLHVQKEQAWYSLKRLDALGQVLRMHLAIRCQRYKVSHPNYLWHCDRHHKLIWWGIAIHGFIDG
ncbi:hypothetical protein DFH08DRAFT_626582, partial [Mycena albidolilacea]